MWYITVDPEYKSKYKFLKERVARLARCHFRAQKNLDFQGPPLPVALEMDLPASKSLGFVQYAQ
jgi:hypothetical protein